MNEKKTTTAPKTSTTSAPKKKGVTRETDTTLAWVEREYPKLAAWRSLGVEWLKGETSGIGRKLNALVTFFERYLVQQGLPLEPAVFLARGTAVPDFYRTACPDSSAGIEYNTHIHAFLQFVLLLEFSEADDDGQPVVSPAFCNKVPWMSKSGHPKHDESVHSPLPYGYLDELRQMLAKGPHFRDWDWAQSALGGEIGQRGYKTPDWFEVTEDQIDQNDPDCVWRVRKVSRYYRGGQVLEMWSPVRWVALLVKLILPLRTFQVRVLDSGEADTRRYAAENWLLNPNLLAQGNELRPLQQGVFRRSASLAEGGAVSTVLYINTNKTADIAKSGPEKGYELPWCFGGPMHQDVFYWLEKLRNWQEKYNPVTRRTAWTELDGRHIKAKSEVQLAGYPSTCFLFRAPEAGEREHHLPLVREGLDRSWFSLLEELQQRIALRGETHENGAPILFLPPPEGQNHGQTVLFPLHSLRVSLITALALEGQVPFHILQKLVGHSRLLMTLYYVKPGATHIREILLGAAKRLEANKGASIQNFLLDTEHDELLRKAICNSVPSLAAAIPQHPAVRNQAGWMLMHHGLCLVGGNTSEEEENGAVGGCYNGGLMIAKGNSSMGPKYGPVPGGSRNCVRCRWFVTEPKYLSALAAHFSVLAYHFDEARNVCLAREKELQDLKKQKIDAEEIGHPYPRLDTYRQTERIWEGAMKRFSNLAEDLVACWRLIERCKAALPSSDEISTKLVPAGSSCEVKAVFEETESELLQLSGVCEHVEVYPDLDPGKAVFRRSQLLDAVLYRDNVKPLFMSLSESEQLLVGNEFMRRLASQMNPANSVLGKRQVIQLMDAGESLREYFKIDLSSLLPGTNTDAALPVAVTALDGVER
jgi:hypothetical protein